MATTWPFLKQKLDEYFSETLAKQIKETLTQEIGAKLDEAVTAATAHLTAEIQQLKDDKETMVARIRNLETLKGEEAARPYGAPPASLFAGADFRKAVTQAVDEQSLRAKKAKNLVIVGLPMPQPGTTDEVSQTDSETVADLCRQMSIHPEKVVGVKRHGLVPERGVQITKVTFDCQDARRRFLSGLRPLLLARHPPPGRLPFYCRPDLMPDELAAQKELNKERVARIAKKEDVVIFDNKVMLRSERDALRTQRRSAPTSTGTSSNS